MTDGPGLVCSDGVADCTVRPSWKMGTPQVSFSFLFEETGISKEETDPRMYCAQEDERVESEIPEDLGIGCPGQ